jgi:hypothetical protein
MRAKQILRRLTVEGDEQIVRVIPGGARVVLWPPSTGRGGILALDSC